MQNVNYKLLVICLNTPPRPTLGAFHAILWQPPPFIKSLQKGANQLGFSWGFQIKMEDLQMTTHDSLIYMWKLDLSTKFRQEESNKP